MAPGNGGTSRSENIRLVALYQHGYLTFFLLEVINVVAFAFFGDTELVGRQIIGGDNTFCASGHCTV